MMQGRVNQNCEAIISIAVGHANNPKTMVDAVIDTGFTGFLSLPNSLITTLGLPWYFRDLGTLGDGSEVVFDMHKASVIFDGQIKVIDVAASEADPLVGMSLLYGFKIRIDVVERGIVIIETLG
ncbi:clan AA aspartic protease [Gloeocapsa sp. PCC 73106]|uniref:clan AA aspartic protease n=1 Tax=Gloeocapsa sp. PCC 73106 TaxID=102232 RepID=UPI0002ABE02A|nr:clan AA aspartic protease [Gloeocapsa sp. PCC 73106]ELR99099.1 clan AA aspartic protease, AF_0612 family [Gloeocapsa sp. PCC 73106]